MAELADALDSGSSEVTLIQVQVLLPAPNSRNPNPCLLALVRVFVLVFLEEYNRKNLLIFHKYILLFRFICVIMYTVVIFQGGIFK